MALINTLISWVVGILDTVLPSIGLPAGFLSALDSGMSLFITLLSGASWFIPLDVFVLCLTTILIIDNWALFMRIGQWVLRTVRGG